MYFCFGAVHGANVQVDIITAQDLLIGASAKSLGVFMTENVQTG